MKNSLRDFESGQWLFGRGTADMKYGHALFVWNCFGIFRKKEVLTEIFFMLRYVAKKQIRRVCFAQFRFSTSLPGKKTIEYEALLLTECYMMEDQAGDQKPVYPIS